MVLSYRRRSLEGYHAGLDPGLWCLKEYVSNVGQEEESVKIDAINLLLSFRQRNSCLSSSVLGTVWVRLEVLILLRNMFTYRHM
jgi:hypothetical protein